MKPQDNERDHAWRWAILSILGALAVAAAGTAAAWPVTYFLQRSPAPQEMAAVLRDYGQNLMHAPDYIFEVYRHWFRAEFRATRLPPVSWLAAWGAGGFLLLVLLSLNPYSFQRTDHGSARVATLADVRRRKMLARTGIPLGQMEGNWLQEAVKRSRLGTAEKTPFGLQWLVDWSFSSPIVRNWETLSCLTLAPPGTGKTVQLISNLLADWPDRGVQNKCPCVIINDPKGEIYEATAGHRSTLGPVFLLNWGDPRVSNRWNPLSPLAYPGGEELMAARTALLGILKNVYQDPDVALALILREQRDGGETWVESVMRNPTCGGVLELKEGAQVARELRDIGPMTLELQTYMAFREKHIDRLGAVLVQDSVGPHWAQTGREFLSGALGYSMARADRLGYEPTFGQLLDDLAGMTREGGFRDLAEEESLEVIAAKNRNLTHEPDEAPLDENGNQDLSGAMLDKWLKECKQYGYPSRVYNDLYATRLKPDKERGSVISTAGAAINIFKAATVRAVTSGCDFRLRDVRGIGRHPTSYYVAVPLEDAESLGRVTGLFFETVAAYALSQQKKEIKKLRPIFLMADEFWTMPALEALLQIPAFGRGQKVMLEIVGQNRGQIGIKYRSKGGEDVVRALEGSMSYRRDLTQTDIQSAKVISESIGNKTVRQVSTGRQLGLSGLFDPKRGGGLFDRNENVSYQARPLFTPDMIMSMEKLDPGKGEWGFQLVRTTAMGMNRPIVCRPIVWFKHPRMRRRAFLKVKEWPEARRAGVAAAAMNDKKDRNENRSVRRAA